MELRGLFMIFVLLFSLGVQAQQNTSSKFLLEISTGADLGWWLYQKGSVNSFLDQGQDYTHHTVTINVETDLLYRIQKLKIGAGISYSAFFENDMNGTRNSEFLVDEYLVTNGASVQFIRYNIQAEYDLIQKSKYLMSAQVRYGWFSIDTTHPEKDNFGYSSYWEFGLHHEFKINRLNFFIRPRYQVSTILPQTENFNDERHKIYGVGIQMGLRLNLFNSL